MQGSKGIFICIFSLLFLSAFIAPKKRNFVTLRCQSDTVYFNKRVEDSLLSSFIVKFDLIVENISSGKIKVHEDYLNAGYKNEYGSTNYYLEISKEENNRRIPLIFNRKLHTQAEYPGEMLELSPGAKKVYHGTTSLYSISEPGKYFIRVVFVNKYKFLGSSSIDSVVVIDTSR